MLNIGSSPPIRVIGEWKGEMIAYAKVVALREDLESPSALAR
jgi:hypothetical protein